VTQCRKKRTSLYTPMGSKLHTQMIHNEWVPQTGWKDWPENTKMFQQLAQFPSPGQSHYIDRFFIMHCFFNALVKGGIKLTFWTDHNTSKLVQSSPGLLMCSGSKVYYYLARFVVLPLSLLEIQDFRDVNCL